MLISFIPINKINFNLIDIGASKHLLSDALRLFLNMNRFFQERLVLEVIDTLEVVNK
jgi:hypothetical protein